MLKHQKIRETMNEVREFYASGVITTAEFVPSMNQLKKELEAEEEKLYAVDRRGHLDLLRFITGTIPDAFMRIHVRFPHLTFPEVIEFEQTMRSFGGSVMTHSGMFAPTNRLNWQHNSDLHYDTSMSWTCCHSIGSRTGSCMSGSEKFMVSSNPTDHKNNVGVWTLGYRQSKQVIEYPDLTNPNPIGRCDTPVSFSLEKVKAEDGRESKTLAEIKAATHAQINAVESEIARLRKKVSALDDLLASLDLLTDT